MCFFFTYYDINMATSLCNSNYFRSHFNFVMVLFVLFIVMHNN